MNIPIRTLADMLSPAATPSADQRRAAEAMLRRTTCQRDYQRLWYLRSICVDMAIDDPRLALDAVQDAKRVWRQLRRMPEDTRLRSLGRSPYVSSWALAVVFLRSVRRLVHCDLTAALGEAKVAVAIAEAIFNDGPTPDRMGRNPGDLLAVAYAHQGNAERLQDLSSARRSMDRVEEILSRDCHRPYLAMIRSYESSFAYDRGEYDRARRYLQEAAAIWHDFEDPHRAASEMVHLAAIYYEEGRIRIAAAILEEQIKYLDVRRNPQLALLVKINLGGYRARLGDSKRAFAYLGAQPVNVAPRILARWHWWTAYAYHAAGSPRQTDRHLRAAEKLLSASGDQYSAGQVQLEHACLLIDSGRFNFALKTLSKLMPLLENMGLKKEATAALQLVKQASEQRLAAEKAVAGIRHLMGDGLRAWAPDVISR